MANNLDHFIRTYHDISSILDPYDLQFLGALYVNHKIPSELRADINHTLLQHDDTYTSIEGPQEDDGSEIESNEDINASLS